MVALGGLEKLCPVNYIRGASASGDWTFCRIIAVGIGPKKTETGSLLEQVSADSQPAINKV